MKKNKSLQSNKKKETILEFKFTNNFASVLVLVCNDNEKSFCFSFFDQYYKFCFMAILFSEGFCMQTKLKNILVCLFILQIL